MSKNPPRALHRLEREHMEDMNLKSLLYVRERAYFEQLMVSDGERVERLEATRHYVQREIESRLYHG